MATLEIRDHHGALETIELQKSQSISVGRQSFNDVVVAEENVGAMHCRIIWMRTHYEVTAATSAGIEVNGHLLQSALLSDGDVIRVGSADLYFHADQPARRSSASKKALPHTEGTPNRKTSLKPAKEGVPEKAPNKKGEAEAPLPDDSSVEAIPEAADKSLANPEETSILSTLRRELSAGRSRPGEQQPFRSPLILGLSMTALTVLVVSVTFLVLIMRQSSDRLYGIADQEATARQYTAALATFEEFVRRYPNDHRRADAERRMGELRIEREIRGAVPAWERGLTALEDVARQQAREEDSANKSNPAIAQYAEEIARGSAKSAEQTADEKFLVTTEKARTILIRQLSDPKARAAAEERVRVAVLGAQRAIQRRSQFNQTLAAMRADLEGKRPLQALEKRRSLLVQYPEFAKQTELQTLVSLALEEARQAVVPVTTEVAAPLADQDASPPSTWPAVTPLFHTRVRSDLAEIGRTVIAVAGDQCSAFDSETGLPRWRRTHGPDASFFPVILDESGDRDALLWESRTQSLLRVKATTGETVWRLPLTSGVVGRPVQYRDAIYLFTDTQELWAISLRDGTVSARLKFPLELAGWPALSDDGEHVYLAGESAILYCLQRSPLEIESVTFTAHARGAIRVAPLPMGELVLLCDNDRLESGLLRVFRPAEKSSEMTEIFTKRLLGRVLDPPVLRGRQLVISTGQERLFGYQVTDTLGETPLVETGRYQIQSGYDGPSDLALGPDDQFWFMSSALRRFRLDASSLQLDPEVLAPGFCTQPIQAVGDRYFVGRRLPQSTGVVLSQIDRDRMVSPWRVCYGGSPLISFVDRQSRLVVLTDQGILHSLATDQWSKPGFATASSREFPIPPQLSAPLQVSRTPEQQLVVLQITGDSQKLFWLDSSGAVQETRTVEKAIALPAAFWKDTGVIATERGLTAIQSQGALQPLLDWVAPPLEEGKPWIWQALVTAGNGALAVDQAGHMIRIERKEADVPHLLETARYQPPKPLSGLAISSGEEPTVAIWDEDGELTLLTANQLQPLSERKGEGPCRQVWWVGEEVLVWWGNQVQLLSGKDLSQPRWSVQHDAQRSLTKVAVVRGKSIWLATREGQILTFDQGNGAIKQVADLGQQLAQLVPGTEGPIYAIAADGTIFQIATPTEVAP